MKSYHKIILGIAIIALAALAFILMRKPDPLTAKGNAYEEKSIHAVIKKPSLSPLAVTPDWDLLEKYQYTISKEKFLSLLTQYYTVSDAWKQFIDISDDAASFVTDTTSNKKFTLHFATAVQKKVVQTTWKKKADIQRENTSKTLSGMHIAIDAGHIGGQFAQMEERWFHLQNDVAVTEGDMTLHVSHLLKAKLEDKGATVDLLRERALPVTNLRPENLLDDARISLPQGSSEMSVYKEAEKLFYRTAEIRARAKIVNESIKPDLVLCLHFNAVSWGNPAQPELVNENHFHMLINGAYTDDEILLDDQRFEMILHILEGNIEEEIPLAASVSDFFAKATKLPPYPYEEHSARAIVIKPHLYLWARNLLANRLYQCPVLFFEPYVMNSKEVYERMQAGDYGGEQFVAGKFRKSIYQEYADAVCDGLVDYYSHKK